MKLILAADAVLDPVNSLIQSALENGDKVALAFGLVLFVAVSLLKIFGKRVPIVDTIAAGLLQLFSSFRGVKPSAPPAKPAEQSGLASVVDIKDPEKK